MLEGNRCEQHAPQMRECLQSCPQGGQRLGIRGERIWVSVLLDDLRIGLFATYTHKHTNTHIAQNLITYIRCMVCGVPLHSEKWTANFEAFSFPSCRFDSLFIITSFVTRPTGERGGSRTAIALCCVRWQGAECI